jgi:hypothetical protein
MIQGRRYNVLPILTMAAPWPPYRPPPLSKHIIPPSSRSLSDELSQLCSLRLVTSHLRSRIRLPYGEITPEQVYSVADPNYYRDWKRYDGIHYRHDDNPSTGKSSKFLFAFLCPSYHPAKEAYSKMLHSSEFRNAFGNLYPYSRAFNSLDDPRLIDLGTRFSREPRGIYHDSCRRAGEGFSFFVSLGYALKSTWDLG